MPPDPTTELPPGVLPADVLLPGTVVNLPGGPAELVALPPDRTARLPWVKRFGLVVVPVTLAGLAWGGPSGYFDVIRANVNREVAVAAHRPADGRALFAQNCASCHGERGDGKGWAALTTKARYFGAEPFKFTATTGTRMPTDAQLIATLKRGIAGSSMPSFAALRDDELQALVGHVRALTRRGRYEALAAKAAADDAAGDGDGVDPVKLTAKAEAQCAVGEVLPVPPAFQPTSAASVAAGRRVFLASCASCHGPDGLGNGPQVGQLKNDNGTPAVPRNLTGGVFKGGREKENLYARIRLGIPGTPMPAGTTLTPGEVEDLMNFVLSLSPEPGQQVAAN